MVQRLQKFMKWTLWAVCAYAALKFLFKMNVIPDGAFKKDFPKIYHSIVHHKGMEKLAIVLVIITSATLLGLEFRAMYLKRKNG